MPTLIPDRIPEHIVRNPGHRAEVEVFESLSDTLEDGWVVFGWSSWVCRRGGGGLRDGEVDFVVAHPDEGALVLEVKGGAISRDPVKGEWRSKSLEGIEHTIDNPFAQAASYRRKLTAKLAEVGIANENDLVPGYAVVFPDCARPGFDLGPDAPDSIVVYRDHLPRLDRRLPEILREWRGRTPGWTPPGREGIDALRQLLARPFQLEVPAGTTIDADARRILELSEDQFHVLDELSRRRRVVVTGGPGTGKTLLAVEKARRLAAVDGFETLLVCFNRPLADHFAGSTRGVPRLTALSFHQFCHRMATRAGIALPDPDRDGLPNDYYRRELPMRLVEALGRLPDRYEAIVLDEGQDFSADDRAALEMCLVEREDGVFYVFQDPSQAVYRDASPWPEESFVPRDLVVNHRNTRRIHEAIVRLGVDTLAAARGPEGRPVELIEAEDAAAEQRELSRVLHRLIRDDLVLPEAIAVLVSSRSVVRDLAPGGRVGAFEITDSHAPHAHRVLMDSITRFKGLERDVVVLAGLRPVDYVNFDALLRVGASRGRAHLVVVGGAEVLARFG